MRSHRLRSLPCAVAGRNRLLESMAAVGGALGLLVACGGGDDRATPPTPLRGLRLATRTPPARAARVHSGGADEATGQWRNRRALSSPTRSASMHSPRWRAPGR